MLGLILTINLMHPNATNWTSQIHHQNGISKYIKKDVPKRSMVAMPGPQLCQPGPLPPAVRHSWSPGLAHDDGGAGLGSWGKSNKSIVTIVVVI